MRRALTALPVLAAIILVAADEPKKPSPKGPEPAAFELRLSDGSTLKAVVLDEKIEVQTKYGKLSVPVADVQKVEFGPRLTAEAILAKDHSKLLTTAAGRANIAFADGHVQLMSEDQLFDRITGKSRFEALWSPLDWSLE